MQKSDYRCTRCSSPLNFTTTALKCEHGHEFSFLVNSNEVPIFDHTVNDSNEYSTNRAVEVHDNALNWLFETFGGSESELRKKLVRRLNLVPGQKVLVTGVGAGNDLPFIANALGYRGEVFAQDYSIQMLRSAITRSSETYKIPDGLIKFSVSDATNLPFFDSFFDAAFHFGGINLFSDIKSGISEMSRVVKPGGKVVIGDEGLSPWIRDTEVGRMILNNNRLCYFQPPLEYLPETARDVTLQWELANYFYVIDFVTAAKPHEVKTNVWHAGSRGGTMATRYSGVLEGVDPNLKAEVYALAEKLGLSRVELLTQIINSGLRSCNLK